MKNMIFGAVALILMTGCTSFGAIKDSTEYERYVLVDLVATHTIKHCGKETATSFVKQLLHETEFLEIYARYIPNNEESHQIAVILHSEAVEFDSRAQQGMSEAYCKTKADIIKQGAERAMEAVMKKRTN